MSRIEIEEVEGVEPPRRARVEDAVETPAEKLERKRDYLEGFLAEKQPDAAPGEPGGGEGGGGTFRMASSLRM
jgi:hypothetical protein